MDDFVNTETPNGAWTLGSLTVFKKYISKIRISTLQKKSKKI
jgi:hypothetical protein